MELLQLKYFLAAAKYQHMTKAAGSLNIAQPALSQAIKRLENELHVSLFIRSGRGIRLSDEGILLAEKLQPIMKALEDIPGELTHAAEAAERTIKLNILSASEMITDIIILYKEQHPEVNFQISQKIDNKNWDIRVSTVLTEKDHKTSQIVLREEIFLAVPVNSPFADREEIALREAAKAPFISHDRNRPFPILTNDFCLQAGFEPEIVFESDNTGSVRDLIGAGFGVAFWPAFSWGEVPSEKMRLLHITKPSCYREIYIARKTEKSSSKVKNDFYQFLSDYLNELQSRHG